MKTKALINFKGTTKLISIFVFANADCWFSFMFVHIIHLQDFPWLILGPFQDAKLCKNPKLSAETTRLSVSPRPKKGHGKVAKKRALFNARQHVKRALLARDDKQRGTF